MAVRLAYCGMHRVLLLGLVLVFTGRSFSQTNVVTGEIDASTTWSGTNLVQGTVTVQPNVVLTIVPGTRVLMDTGALLVIQGQLLADGTESQPILFTRPAAGRRWRGIRFVGATPSRFQYCTFEYADSAGTHLDYYDNDCDLATAPPNRNYHEAIVSLGTSLLFESCVFQNLPDNTGARDGDAIAIISDDPEHPGTASAHINNCRFISIGQGIHTRHSFVLVENSFFTDHRGDNDDIDLYGESDPPPIIRNNIFLNPRDDDMINPTRSSAIIVGNVIVGGSDHGIVLRDKCSPIVMNNLIANTPNAGIAVQNQCDAIIVNNTIVNSARGIRFFDHTTRWGPPYCLTPGSGRATIINTIIWNCTTSLELQDSSYPQDRASRATVINCNVEGGQATASVAANSILTWGDGNTNTDPAFINDFRLRSTSPMIDLGIDPMPYLTNLPAAFVSDPDGVPRPLDGDGDGTARFDLGAYEFLLATADSNGDGIPDGWLHRHGLNPVDPLVGGSDPDLDLHTTLQEWIADTNPTNATSFLHIRELQLDPSTSVEFVSSSNRIYTLEFSSSLLPAVWNPVPGTAEIPGTGTHQSLTDPGGSSNRFYRLRVELPRP